MRRLLGVPRCGAREAIDELIAALVEFDVLVSGTGVKPSGVARPRRELRAKWLQCGHQQGCMKQHPPARHLPADRRCSAAPAASSCGECPSASHDSRMPVTVLPALICSEKSVAASRPADHQEANLPVPPREGSLHDYMTAGAPSALGQKSEAAPAAPSTIKSANRRRPAGRDNGVSMNVDNGMSPVNPAQRRGRISEHGQSVEPRSRGRHWTDLAGCAARVSALKVPEAGVRAALRDGWYA